MKKISLLIVIGLSLSFQLKAKKIEGRILFEDDTIEVLISVPFKFFTQEPNYEKLQYRVKYYDSAGKKVILRPHEAKEIQFKYGNEEVRMLSRYNSLGFVNIFSMSDNIFLKLETDGILKLFSYYYTQQSPGMYGAVGGAVSVGYSYTIDRYILQKEEGELKWPNGLSFRRDMMDFFSDCPALVEKIDNKDFRKKELKLIVAFYNDYCW